MAPSKGTGAVSANCINWLTRYFVAACALTKRLHSVCMGPAAWMYGPSSFNLSWMPSLWTFCRAPRHTTTRRMVRGGTQPGRPNARSERNAPRDTSHHHHTLLSGALTAFGRTASHCPSLLQWFTSKSILRARPSMPRLWPASLLSPSTCKSFPRTAPCAPEVPGGACDWLCKGCPHVHD